MKARTLLFPAVALTMCGAVVGEVKYYVDAEEALKTYIDNAAYLVDNGRTILNNNYVCCDKTGEFRIVTDYARRGDHSIGLRTRQLDVVQRTEFKWTPFDTELHNTDCWMGMSILFGPDCSGPGTKWPILAQWWAGSPLSPPISLDLVGNLAIQFRVRGQDGNRLIGTTVTVERGKWYDIVVNWKTDPAGSGYVHVWCNGVKFGDYTGPSGYDQSMSIMVKWGIYFGNTVNGPISAYYDELRIGNSFSEVDPAAYDQPAAAAGNAEQYRIVSLSPAGWQTGAVYFDLTGRLQCLGSRAGKSGTTRVVILSGTPGELNPRCATRVLVDGSR